MQCSLCESHATVHLTQIPGGPGSIDKLDLCEECARARDLNTPEGFARVLRQATHCEKLKEILPVPITPFGALVDHVTRMSHDNMLDAAMYFIGALDAELIMSPTVRRNRCENILSRAINYAEQLSSPRPTLQKP